MRPIRGARSPKPDSTEALLEVHKNSTMCFSIFLVRELADVLSLPHRPCGSIIDPTVEIPNIAASVEHVHRDSDDKIRLADQRLAISVLLGPGFRNHPHVKVVVRAVTHGDKQTRRAHGTHRSRASTFALIEYFHRPCDVDRAELDVIRSVALAVRAVLVSDRLELLISATARLVAESCHG